MAFSRRITTSSLLCFVSKRENSASQCIIAVSPKVNKSAVKRNRIKRIIRAALQQLVPSIRSPIRCLIVVKKDCSMKKSTDMLKELDALKTV